MSSNESEDKEQAKANFKLITTTTGVRVSQACDRCRVKKIKCNGLTPCHNCARIGFECKTSDKLTRRAFPKGYTENLERKLKELEEENRFLKVKCGEEESHESNNGNSHTVTHTLKPSNNSNSEGSKVLLTQSNNQTVQINNPIDQIFNLNEKGMIIGNDNLNFESQFNHLLINLNLPFLKITNSHNYLLNDPNSYLYNPSYATYNQLSNKDLDVIYNPLTGNNNHGNDAMLVNSQLPFDIYDLFIKLINNFKKLFNNKKELDIQVTQFFLTYNIIIPIFDYKEFMVSYDAFHTMYPFMFTYDDATINGYNLLNNDYHVVNEFLMTVIQLYAMIMINDPTINLNLLLNHSSPGYSISRNAKLKDNSESIVRSLYDFLPFFNSFHVSVSQLQTYQLCLLYSLLTNNKEKSLVLSSLINSLIGILGINLNSKNLFFNDLSLNIQQKRNRVKIFWVFKVLLKCFNLKFGFKPSLNTTVINPVTIDRYFQLTPEKLSSLIDPSAGEHDELFETLLKPSVEFLNLMNIIIPSSFSPNYYQYLKQGSHSHHSHSRKGHLKDLDWILNDDDGDGNDGNLNYNFTQFLTIDKNLSNWRESLREKTINLNPLQTKMNLPSYSPPMISNLYHELPDLRSLSEMSQDSIFRHYDSEVPDVHTAAQLIKIQLNFQYLLIRSMNYLNFIIDKELTQSYYLKIAKISQEILNYFILIFDHISQAPEVQESKNPQNVVMESLGIDVDEDGFVINDFSARRGRNNNTGNFNARKKLKRIPPSPFNFMLNGLSMTIINLKKSIILQMLYLLICQLKFFKKNELNSLKDSFVILSKSVSVFIKVFINYDIDTSKGNPRKYREDELFKKLINDELKEEILKEQDSDVEEEDEMPTFSGIDWDDEDMDEDLKYLKILKFIKYKSHVIHNYFNKINLITSSRATPNSFNVEDNKHSSLPVPSSSLYGSASLTPNFNLTSGLPSLTKLDDPMGNENYSSSLLTNVYPKVSAEDDLVKKEKLAINDLMNLKHGGRTQNSGIFSNGDWNGRNEHPSS
ncbi:uncharacterized protein PRCAT00005439001 [Priceomyces carsonii]|uniref:uncharacterized protein n=1 Tax=Priceomyces carsonii TaxID=28549 RepID=UPI002EDB7055|nr:unnamed protein product [Priceomyces carsonii]